MTGFAMVLVCPYRSLVPRLSADPLAKFRGLWQARGTILFKRLQFFMPLLGRNHNHTNMKSKTPKSKKEKKKISVDQGWEAINPRAAGIDIGAREHFACVPARATPKNVRSFGTFTADLNALADWFKECGVTSVAMEATGVYWIPVFQILEERGFAVILVNARQTRMWRDARAMCRTANGFSGCTPMDYSKVLFGPRIPIASCGPICGIAMSWSGRAARSLSICRRRSNK